MTCPCQKHDAVGLDKEPTTNREDKVAVGVEIPNLHVRDSTHGWRWFAEGHVKLLVSENPSTWLPDRASTDRLVTPADGSPFSTYTRPSIELEHSLTSSH